MSNEEFMQFLLRLTKNLVSAGVPEDMVTSNIAKTMFEREKVAPIVSKKGSSKGEVFQTRVSPQPVYGPAPKQEPVMVETRVSPQPVYGPAPRPEPIEVHVSEPIQAVYGPPPRR